MSEEIRKVSVEKGEGGLSFKLPSPPPSINSIYNVLYGLRRIELKPEIRKYKTMNKVFVPDYSVNGLDRIAFKISILQNWYAKNGNIKRQDVHNMCKVLIDMVAEKQGWDDSQVWEVFIEKVQSEKESCVFMSEWKV